jgi:DNA-binding PadR family transcriptional regulator
MEVSKSTLYILMALAHEPLHGYAIMKQVLEDSEGTITLGPGTLYGALKRLLDNQWVEEVTIEEDDTRVRRHYQLTDVGRQRLAVEIENLQRILQLAQQYNQSGTL